MNKNNTIFDDVFKTIVQKMPELVIPVINEVFHENYPENEPIEQLRNEHQEKNGERITDSCLGIRDKLYHVECQSTPDNRMVIRMVEYDFATALERVDLTGEMCEIKMPRSCVIYLRHNSRTPDTLKMKVVFSENQSAIYQVPIIKLKNYTKDEIFEKRLLMFLPFYIMRYEGKYKEIEETPEMFNKFIDEYDNIRVSLDKLATREEKSVVYSDLIQLIVRISDYMLEQEEILKERIGEIMGGHVLELESERLIRVGVERMGKLYQLMERDERLEEFSNASQNSEALEQLFIEYGL